MQKRVKGAERKLNQRGGTVTAGKVIAEQSFGFWTSFFDPHHYKLIRGVVIQSFQHKPSTVNRSVISKKLNHVRRFRNRVYHSEPICFENQHIDFSKARVVRRDIYELLSWIDDDLSDYVSYFDSINSKINTVDFFKL